MRSGAIDTEVGNMKIDTIAYWVSIPEMPARYFDGKYMDAEQGSEIESGYAVLWILFTVLGFTFYVLAALLLVGAFFALLGLFI